MEKVVNFLEKNVQWLVLGLSGAVFLLMVWMYVVQSPVTVAVDNKDLTPGEIDEATFNGPVQAYKRKVQESVPPAIGDVNFIDPFKRKIDPSEKPVDLLPLAMVKRTLPVGVVDGPGTVVSPDAYAGKVDTL